jgi:hypothetical protein
MYTDKQILLNQKLARGGRDGHSLEEFERLELPGSPHLDTAFDRFIPFSGFEKSHQRVTPFSIPFLILRIILAGVEKKKKGERGKKL